MPGQGYADQRYYNSNAGRFYTPDPSTGVNPGNPTSWNKYAYTNDDPVNSNDPHGTDSCPVNFYLDGADIGSVSCNGPCAGAFVGGTNPYNSPCGGGNGPGWGSLSAIGAAIQQVEASWSNRVTTTVNLGAGETGTLTEYGGSVATLQFGDAQTAEVAVGICALQPEFCVAVGVGAAITIAISLLQVQGLINAITNVIERTNNQRQNRQFAAAVRSYERQCGPLTQDQIRALHDATSGKGLS